MACKGDKAASRRIFLEPWYDSIVTERGASRYAKPQREKERKKEREKAGVYIFSVAWQRSTPRKIHAGTPSKTTFNTASIGGVQFEFKLAQSSSARLAPLLVTKLRYCRVFSTPKISMAPGRIH